MKRNPAKNEFCLTYRGIEIDFKHCDNGKWIVAIDGDVEICEEEFHSMESALRFVMYLIDEIKSDLGEE